MNYNLSEQEETCWCFPACLQAVLRRYEIEESQEDIARVLGVDDNGARTERVREFLRVRGFSFDYYHYNATPFNEPDSLLSGSVARGLDVVVAVPGTRIKHVLLLQEFQDPELVMLDPEGETKTRNLHELLREMSKKKAGGFGVIKRLAS